MIAKLNNIKVTYNKTEQLQTRAMGVTINESHQHGTTALEPTTA